MEKDEMIGQIHHHIDNGGHTITVGELPTAKAVGFLLLG